MDEGPEKPEVFYMGKLRDGPWGVEFSNSHSSVLEDQSYQWTTFLTDYLANTIDLWWNKALNPNANLCDIEINL